MINREASSLQSLKSGVRWALCMVTTLLHPTAVLSLSCPVENQDACGLAWEYSVWQPPTKVEGEALPQFKSFSHFDSGAASAETGCPRVETRESFSSDPC